MSLYLQTTATQKIASLSKRIRIIQGGTSASKTISILIYLIACAQSDTTPTLTSIVSESYPHLKRGAIRDFLNIMKEHKYFKESRWNMSSSTYTFETGSTIEFFSADQPDKLRGARRQRLFINECNNVRFEAFEQLEVRTTEFIFLDYNPTTEFWVFSEVIPNRNDWEQLILTYKDNEALSQEIIDSIEQRKDRKQWWQVYGLGQLGEVDTRIYTGWQVVDEVPFEARLERYGLDFGYTNDPTAIVAVYYYNGGYILDEIAYQTRLQNKAIADILNAQDQKALVIADSAEPKSIDDIRGYNVTIAPAQKGKDSIRRGIGYVQEQRISVTKRSINLLKEYRNYVFLVDDATGKKTNDPVEFDNHLMDAVRYAIASIKDPMRNGAHVHYSPSAMPRNNLTPFQNSIETVQGAPIELNKTTPMNAHTHIPRL